MVPLCVNCRLLPSVSLSLVILLCVWFSLFQAVSPLIVYDRQMLLNLQISTNALFNQVQRGPFQPPLPGWRLYLHVYADVRAPYL